MQHGVVIRASSGIKRRTNHLLRSSAVEGDAPLPYFCECADDSCMRAVWLTPHEYDEARRESDAIVASHESSGGGMNLAYPTSL